MLHFRLAKYLKLAQHGMRTLQMLFSVYTLRIV